jgi:LPS export ABC transporter protein LptC
MITKPRNLLWLTPLFLFLSSPLWQPPVAKFLTPRGGYDPRLAQLDNSPTQNFTMDSVAITLTSEGREEWQIDAERANTGANDREIEMVRVNARYVGKGKEPIHIVSDRGKYSIDDRHLILIENVVITKPRTNERMLTDLLHYYDATKMAVSPGNVNLSGPKFNLTAGRMDYDLASDGYDFSNRVKVSL